MMLRRQSACGVLALCVAGDQGDKSCDGNTFQMVECLRRRPRMLAPQVARSALRAAQRLWVQYRDANCLYYGMGEGHRRLDAGECMRSMTEARAKELEGLGHQ